MPLLKNNCRRFLSSVIKLVYVFAVRGDVQDGKLFYFFSFNVHCCFMIILKTSADTNAGQSRRLTHCIGYVQCINPNALHNTYAPFKVIDWVPE